MKNLKYTGLLFASLLLVGVAPAVAQDVSSVKQEVKKNADKASEDVEKIKAQQRDKASSVKKEATSIKKEATDKTVKQVKEVKQDGGSILSAEDRYAQVKKGYKKRMEMAKTPEEKEELKKKMMAELEKIKAGGKDIKDGGVVKGEPIKDTDVKKNMSDHKKEVKETKESAVKDAKAKRDAAKSEVKMTREYGKTKVDNVRKVVDSREAALVNRAALIKKGENAITKATKKLDIEAASGTMSDEEVAAKRARIAKAQAKLDKLKGSMERGQATYTKQKSTLSSMYQEN